MFNRSPLEKCQCEQHTVCRGGCESVFIRVTLSQSLGRSLRASGGHRPSPTAAAPQRLSQVKSLSSVLAAVLLLPRRCAAPYGILTFGNADTARRTGEHAGVQF